MSARCFRLLTALAVTLLGSLAVPAVAAETASAPASSGPVVELPPMIVEDNSAKVKWLYAQVGTEEVLSRASESATKTFLEGRARARHRLRAIVPDEFLANIGGVTLLAEEEAKPRAGDAVAGELLGSAAVRGMAGLSDVVPRPVRFLPNLRLDDRDLSGLFAYLKEDSAFETTDMRISASYLREMLERRTPILPPWLVEGLLAIHAQEVRGQPPLTLRAYTWMSELESRALAQQVQRPRALLSAEEMFAPDTLRGEGNQHPLRRATLQAQVGLFVRWGIDPANRQSEAFWKFARESAEQRVTEALFERCFGFGYADLRDRLSDYLPRAVRESIQLYAGPDPSLKVELRPATPAEVARLRGAWERLEIDYVQKRYRDYATRYIEQAQRTLRRAYENGDRDPRLMTDLGLAELAAGNATGGLPFLDAAITAGVQRPRAYYEVARSRFAELLRDQPANRLFSEGELTGVLGPIRRAVALTPALPEIYGVLADVWLRARTPPPATDLAALSRGAQLFALHPTVGYRLALALARFGRPAEAGMLLARGIDSLTDEALRARYAQLQAALAKAGTGGAP